MTVAETAEETVVVSFHGVRGSTPCSCPSVQRYGGNTSCVSVETPDADPIVLDLGTGLRSWGHALGLHSAVTKSALTINALVTHLHLDHIQGLPFFAPLLCERTTLNIFGSAGPPESLAEAFDRIIAPPFFPIRTADLPATINFHDISLSDFPLGRASVMARPVPHVGSTNGYRLDLHGFSLAYVPDHQEPADDPTFVDDRVLELCDGADLLIHDGQYWPEELARKRRWGHSTPDYALEVARQAGVETLVLFHHDPAHDDTSVDEMVQRLRGRASEVGVSNVLAATEGARLTFTAPDTAGSCHAGVSANAGKTKTKAIQSMVRECPQEGFDGLRLQ